MEAVTRNTYNEAFSFITRGRPTLQIRKLFQCRIGRIFGFMKSRKRRVQREAEVLIQVFVDVSFDLLVTRVKAFALGFIESHIEAWIGNNVIHH